MKPYLSLILFTFCLTSLFAQKEINNWYYGGFSGFTFVNGNPQTLTGITNTGFNVNAPYSDANGNLKFVFAGNRVLDRNYNVMPGSNLFVFGTGASYHIALTAVFTDGKMARATVPTM